MGRGANNNSTLYNYQGEIAEIIYLDRALSDGERVEVEKFFKRKYGIEKVCKLPTIHEGYKIKSCNTERENILPSECKVICDKDNGYLPNEYISFDDENTAELEGGAECNEANGKFEFVGCYPNGEITVSQHAKFIIKNKSVLHLDASHGVEVSSENDGVMSWSAVENKNKNSYMVKRLTPENTYHPTVNTENGVKSILFPGNVGQKMTNDYFKELART